MYKKVKNLYQEPEHAGDPYRMAYYEGVQQMIEKRREQCKEERIAFGQNIAADREKARLQYIQMLGWPLSVAKEPLHSVNEWLIYEDADYEIKRMQFEMLQGVPFYGLLFRHKNNAALPLVISQHGGGGTPEICSGFYEGEYYRDMTMRVFHKGVNVFAPQMLMWYTPMLEKDPRDIMEIRRDMDNSLKQLGGSIAALEIYELQRLLDYMEEQPYCNGQFGMVGLSYGGFYTMYTAAAEPRIKAALSCSHFNDRITYNWSDKVWFNAGNTFLDAQVGALVCPRFLRIEVGAVDHLFEVESAEQEYEILKKYYAEKPENLQFHVFQGTHEFCLEDEGLDQMLLQLELNC